MSTDILRALDLLEVAKADELTARSRSFAPVHLGTQDVEIGTVLELVHAEDGLLPPRTGHLGNWEDIVLGRSGPMDFNTSICGNQYGYPLIYGFTRTEADTEGGDEAYLPGSLVQGGRRQLLPLFTWDGRRFVERDRSRPLFCPMVQTPVDGELSPLVEVHWQRMLASSGYRFTNWADSLVDNGDLLVDMLCVLLAQARANANPRRPLADLISHGARLDGTVERCDLQVEGDGFVLDGHRFASAPQLAEAVLILLRGLIEPGWFLSQLGELPPVLPVPSLLLTNVLFGLFGDHRPDQKGVPDEGPFITHLHWGARAMAGCPPRRNGYFARRSRVSAMRAITGTLVDNFPDVSPLCFVLLPAQVFMLCPPSTAPADIDSMDALVKCVLTGDPDQAYAITLTELRVRGGELSDYLRGRFRQGSGVLSDGRVREPAVPVEPAGFRQLTFRQASAVVAAFEETFSAGYEG